MAGYPTTGVTDVSPVQTQGAFRYDGDNVPYAAQVRSGGGTVTLASGAGSISGINFGGQSSIIFTLKTASGTISAAPYLTAINIVNNTGTVAAGAGDNSTYNWIVIG
jgi:hypothetical protein